MRTCPNCGTPNRPDARFCDACGYTLAATSVGGRTVVLPRTDPGHLDAEEAKTLVERVKKTFGQTAAGPPPATLTKGDPNQREHTTLVMDRSGSMGEEFDEDENKMVAAIRGGINLVLNKAKLDPDDEIALVAFNSRARALLPFQPLRTHRREMIRALQSLTPDNGTDINEGLKAARKLFDWSRQDVVRRVVLLTDGHGGRPEKTAEALKEQGTVVDVIGVSDTPENVNERLLRKIASRVGGQLRYRFIKDHQTLLAHYTRLANKTATM